MIVMREIMKNDLYFVDVEVVIGYATTTIGRVFIKNWVMAHEVKPCKWERVDWIGKTGVAMWG